MSAPLEFSDTLATVSHQTTKDETVIPVLFSALAAAMLRQQQSEGPLTKEEIAQSLWVYWDQLEYLHQHWLEPSDIQPVLPPTWGWIKDHTEESWPGRIYAFETLNGNWHTSATEENLLGNVLDYGIVARIDVFEVSKPIEKQLKSVLRIRGAKTSPLIPFAGFTNEALRLWLENLAEWEMQRMASIPEEHYISFHDPSRHGHAMTHQRAKSAFSVYRKLLNSEPDLKEWNAVVQKENAFFGSPLVKIIMTLAAWRVTKPRGSRALMIGASCSWGFDENGMFQQYRNPESMQKIASILARHMLDEELAYAKGER
jgi:hypothetical protein